MFDHNVSRLKSASSARAKFGLAILASLSLASLAHGDIIIGGSGLGSVVGQVTIDSEVFDFSVDIDAAGNFVLDGLLSFESADGSTLNIVGLFGNVDPVQTLAIGVTDSDAPSSFAVSISAPLMPTIPGAATFTTDLFGSCTDGAADGCGATPFLTSLLSQFTVNSGGGIVSDVGPAFNFPVPGGSYSAPGDAGVINCASMGSCTSFETLISFTGSGGGDAISFTSRFELNPVPIPGAVLLLGSGLFGLLGFRRKRT